MVSFSNGRIPSFPMATASCPVKSHLSPSCIMDEKMEMFHPARSGSHLICKSQLTPHAIILLMDLRGMAYGIMGGSRDSHMLTYQTTRKVKCIYFDGESATLFGSGQLDSQMLHIWGNTTGPTRPDTGFGGLWEEYARATGLCDWLRESKLGGPGWGYEGIVRMNAGFEMIWCDFSSPSLRLISHLNITAPLLPGDDGQEDDVRPELASYYPLPPSPTRSDKSTDPSDPPRPPTMGGRIDREPFWTSQAWTWYYSATTHYGSSANGPGLGETRVKPIACGFLSYYAPAFLSQALPRAEEERKGLNLTASGAWTGPGNTGNRSDALEALTRRRRYHTLEHISTSDAANFRADSERVLRDLLSSSPQNCTGIDWMTMLNDIVQSYAGPLNVLVKTIQQYETVIPTNETTIKKWMADVRDQTHTFLLPFLEYPTDAADDLIWTRESVLYKDTFSKCRYQYTRLLAPEEGFTLGPEETTIKLSVEDVTGSICSTLVDIGLAVEGIWESRYNIPAPNPSSPLNLKRESTRWQHSVEELMAWLGWAGEWTGCKEKCAWDESCFIPMWPMIPMGGGPGRGRPGRGGRGPPGYWRPGYGRPGYGRPAPGYGMPGFPPNQTGPGGPPGRGFNPWESSEDDLWQPKCVKSNYILEGGN